MAKELTLKEIKYIMDNELVNKVFNAIVQLGFGSGTPKNIFYKTELPPREIKIAIDLLAKLGFLETRRMKQEGKYYAIDSVKYDYFLRKLKRMEDDEISF